jgi:hypothetical protein
VLGVVRFHRLETTEAADTTTQITTDHQTGVRGEKDQRYVHSVVLDRLLLSSCSCLSSAICWYVTPNLGLTHQSVFCQVRDKMESDARDYPDREDKEQQQLHAQDAGLREKIAEEDMGAAMDEGRDHGTDHAASRPGQTGNAEHAETEGL